MKYFTIEELSASAEAKRMGIDNRPPLEAEVRLHYLVVNVLDPLRHEYGQPIFVSSGYRCPRLNRAVGGAETSQHVRGEAADIYVSDKRGMAELFARIYYQHPYDQLIWERGDDESPAWIHVSYREGENRRECLRYDGKRYYSYKPTLKK